MEMSCIDLGTWESRGPQLGTGDHERLRKKPVGQLLQSTVGWEWLVPGATASQGGKQEGQPAGTKAGTPMISVPKCLAVRRSPVTLVSRLW